MREQKFEFGSRVKDRITGFKGIVRAFNVWDNGCMKYAVQAQVLTPESKIPDVEWIDEQQLVLMEEASKKEVDPSGGPMPTERMGRMPRG